MNKIKISATVAALCLCVYGGSVYLFSKHVSQIIEGLPSKAKQYTSVSPYKFQINIRAPEKTEDNVRLQFNPIFSTANVIYLSPIEAKIEISENEFYNVKYDMDKPTSLGSLKLSKSILLHDFNKSIIQLFLDGDIIVEDYEESNIKQTVNLSVDGKGSDFVKEILPLQISMDADIKKRKISFKDELMSVNGDMKFTMSQKIGKGLKRSYDWDMKADYVFGLKNLGNVAKFAFSKFQEDKDFVGKLSEAEKEMLANEGLQWVKTIKMDLQDKRLETYDGNSKPVLDLTSTARVDFSTKDQYSWVQTFSGVLNVDGQPEFIQELMREFKLPETEQKTLSSAAQKTMGSVKFDGELDVSLSDHGDALKSGKNLMKAINTLAMNGAYDLNAKFKLKLNDDFAVKCSFDGGFKERPFGKVKVALSKNAYSNTLDFAEKLHQEGKGTSISTTIESFLTTAKTFPYAQVFKSTKDKETAEENDVFEFTF